MTTQSHNRPSYADNDPKGWCGDPRRGAALGRSSRRLTKGEQSALTQRLYLSRVRLDSGGYDLNGTYFGVGAPLYWVSSADGEIDYVFRAIDRAKAKKTVRGTYPNARFWR